LLRSLLCTSADHAAQRSCPAQRITDPGVLQSLLRSLLPAASIGPAKGRPVLPAELLPAAGSRPD
jgi:hypothetical protein